MRKLFTLLLSFLLLLPVLGCDAYTGIEFIPRQKQYKNLTYDYFEVRIPYNKEAADKINTNIVINVNRALRKYVLKLQDGIRLTEHLQLIVSYEGERFLSTRLKDRCDVERAAHPSKTIYGTTYALASGEVVPWQNVIRSDEQQYFTLKAINEKILAVNAPWRSWLYQDFTGLTELPKDYYLDATGCVHFPFQRYEIAPYCYGIIDINMQKGCR